MLSGLIGALAVFILGWLREWWRNERERRGLLRLLSSEIQHNSIVAEIVRDSGKSLLSSPAASSMTAETWRESRESALSLPPDLLEDLDDYYRPLEILLTLRGLPGMEEERLERLKRQMLGEALGQEFVRSRDPWGEYERVMLDAQELAQARIGEYLAYPPWGRPFLKVGGWLKRQGRGRSRANRPGG